jgi:hypothetical protein
MTLCATLKACGLVINEDLALVRFVHATKYLDQRGLACTVFPEKSKDLAAVQAK